MKAKLILLGLCVCAALLGLTSRLAAQQVVPPDTVEVVPIGEPEMRCLILTSLSEVINDAATYHAIMQRLRDYENFRSNGCDTYVTPNINFSNQTLIMFDLCAGGCVRPRNVTKRMVYLPSENKYIVSISYTQVGMCAPCHTLDFFVMIPKLISGASVEFKEIAGYVEE